MRKISDQYLQEQKRLHDINDNYGRASLSHAQTIKNLLSTTKFKTLSDYGAGKKNLQKGLLELGLNDIDYFPYDPVFPEYGSPKPAELVCCIDVMEHLEEEFLEEILDEIRSITINLCYFSIATIPAKKTLSDGRNAHILLKPSRWWLPKLCEIFNIEFLKNTKSGFIVLCKSLNN
mgnify:CR=1 FL=1|tara:strand:+ start:281 stop:808 length:528 start_codon:yes stop_codon:yes gene_type:complete